MSALAGILLIYVGLFVLPQGLGGNLFTFYIITLAMDEQRIPGTRCTRYEPKTRGSVKTRRERERRSKIINGMEKKTRSDCMLHTHTYFMIPECCYVARLCVPTTRRSYAGSWA